MSPSTPTKSFRWPVGLRSAVLIALPSAVVWGVLTYLTNSVYMTLALLIGAAVGYVLVRPVAGAPWRTAVPLMLLAGVLAAVAIILGDALYFVLLIRREGTPLGEILSAVLSSLGAMAIQTSGSSILVSLIGLGIGTGAALSNEA